jgi:hypothetical protein
MRRGTNRRCVSEQTVGSKHCVLRSLTCSFVKNQMTRMLSPFVMSRSNFRAIPQITGLCEI